METLPPAERRVIVSTRSDKGDVAEVTVRDFGMGLPKDRPDKVFDHFFSTKQKGMGMGLAIVRSLRVRPKTSSWITKLSHHEADGREFQEREGIAVEIFPVLCKAATTVEPRNRAFYDPALG